MFFFDEFKERFVDANAVRFHEITEEATREVQKLGMEPI